MVEKEKADMHTLYRVVSAFFCALDCIKVCPGIWEGKDMSKLLYANFFRLWKNKLFLTGLGFMFFAGGFLVFQQYRQLVGYGAAVKLDSTFFVYNIMIGVVSAVFCSLFLNVEYTDGTIRNKVIVGHKRTDIYVANLITTIIASFSLCASYILANIVIGIPLIGKLHLSVPKTLLIILGSMVTVAALCSIFTMANMLIQSKGIAPVVCIVAMFLSMAFVNEVQRVLDNPQYWYDGSVNTAYVGGKERAQLEFVYNALPAGQEKQYAGRNLEHMKEMCLYAVGTTVVTSAVGVFFFRRKDIK